MTVPTPRPDPDIVPVTPDDVFVDPSVLTAATQFPQGLIVLWLPSDDDTSFDTPYVGALPALGSKYHDVWWCVPLFPRDRIDEYLADAGTAKNLSASTRAQRAAEAMTTYLSTLVEIGVL